MDYHSLSLLSSFCWLGALHRWEWLCRMSIGCRIDNETLWIVNICDIPIWSLVWCLALLLEFVGSCWSMLLFDSFLLLVLLCVWTSNVSWSLPLLHVAMTYSVISYPMLSLGARYWLVDIAEVWMLWHSTCGFFYAEQVRIVPCSGCHMVLNYSICLWFATYYCLVLMTLASFLTYRLGIKIIL